MEITRMREERKKKGWSQKKVGDEIGLTRTAVHDIETLQQLPSYKILVKLEDLFELNHRDLFKIMNEEKRPNNIGVLDGQGN